MDAVVEVMGTQRETCDSISPYTRVEEKIRNIELSHYPFFHVQLLKLPGFENILSYFIKDNLTYTTVFSIFLNIKVLGFKIYLFYSKNMD